MTSQTPKTRYWRRAVTGTALAAGLMVGLAGTAVAEPADPADPAAETDVPAPEMTADQALAIIQNEYDTGAGGGQLSNLIHDVLTLRAQGFKPSNANKQAIVDALDHRPNQTPLVRALQDTLAYQVKLKQRAQAAPENPFTIGINQYDPENPGVLGTFGIDPGGAGNFNQPVG